MVADIARIEDRIDRVAAGGVAVNDTLGGVRFQNMMEVMEFAKLMAIAGNAVPKHLQGNPGSCLAVCIQSLEWGFSPFSVASMHFEVNGRHAYMSQLIHAVIEKHAPLKQRLRSAYEGEGDELVCIVTGHIKGEVDALEYRSPKLGKITPKNSPLWKTDPQQQLWYYASRAWCRRFCPDVLLGVYARDEIEDSHIGAEHAKDVTKPDVASRLKGSKGRGFNHQHVERETGGPDETPTATAPEPATAEAPAATTEPAKLELTNSNSPPEPAPPSGPDATPAPAPGSAPAGAGTSSQSPSVVHAEQSASGGEEEQATESGNPAQDDSAGLPGDWRRQYAAALGSATKVGQLPRKATAYWEKHGGWTAHKSGPNADTAAAIYNAFANHFDNPEARDAILHELEAS